MQASELKRSAEKLADHLFHAVPSGVGQGGKHMLSGFELDQLLAYGAPHLVKQGFGAQSDLEHCEENGAMVGANPDKVSAQAKQRGLDQLGTLGSGNHFLEVQEVAEIFDETAAAVLGLVKGGLTVMIHCGSRGLGHQVCTDYVRMMMPLLPKWNIQLPDRELVCAPVLLAEGTSYYQAMQAAANFAWANRHMIAHAVRESFQKVFGNDLWLSLLYDVSHNMGKHEKHMIDSQHKELLVHRKGATRSFGPGNALIPAAYQSVG
jgi:tRNA-splicing ligase RtcB